MAENDKQDEVAGFFKGNVTPEDLRKKSTSAPEKQEVEAAPDGGTAGFLGGSGATPKSVPSESASPTPAQSEPVPLAATANAGFLGSTSSPEPAPEQPDVSVAESEVSLPEEPAVESLEQPQPLPDPSAPAADFFARADELVDEGYANSAITAYRQGLEREPGNIVAINNLAMIYIELERYNDAQTELEQAINKGAENGEIYNNLGFILRKQNNDIAAADAYENYLKLTPDVEESERIQEWIVATRSAGEEDFSIPTEEISPATETSFITKAESLYADEDYEGAILVYNNLLTQNPNSISALDGRGRSQIKAGLYEEGIATIKEIETMASPLAERSYILGYALRALQRDQEAAVAYGKFLELEPDAENADKIREWIEQVAVPEQESGAKQGTGDGAGFLAAASAEAVAGEQEAESEEGKIKIDKQPVWATALEEHPENQDYLLQGGDSEAVEVEVEQESEPASVEAEQDASVPVEAEQRQEDAVIAATEPEIQGEKSVTLEDAQKMLEDDDLPGALSAAQAVVKSDSSNIEAKIFIARCFGRQGEFAKAMPILKNVLSADENIVEAWFFLGRCQQETNRLSEAKKSLEKVCEISPDSDVAESAKGILAGLKKTQDRGVCSQCLEAVLVDTLEDVEGEPVCAACREQSAPLHGDAQSGLEDNKQVKIAARGGKREQGSRAGKAGAGKIVAVLLLLVVLGSISGLLLLKQIKPGVFARLTGSSAVSEQPIIADDDPFASPDTSEKTSTGGEDDFEQIKDEDIKTPAQLTTITSLPGNYITSGFTYKYRLAAKPIEELEGAEYRISWSENKPVGEYIMLTEKGVFTWKPAAADMGKKFKLKFTIFWPDLKEGLKNSLSQSVSVRVGAFPTVRELPLRQPLPFEPGKANYFSCADLDGDKVNELVYLSGTYWQGKIIVLRKNKKAVWFEVATKELPGRPGGLVAASLGKSGKSVLFVIDWWNRNIYKLELVAGKLEVTWQEDLPARPLMLTMAQSKAGTSLAVYCANGTILLYKPGENGELEVDSRLQSFALGPWKNMSLVDLLRGKNKNGLEVVLTAMGKIRPNVQVISIEEASTWRSFSVGNGIVECVASRSGSGLKNIGEGVIVSTGGQRARLENLLALSGERAGTVVSAALPGSLLSLAVADIDGNKIKDVIAFRRKEMLLQVQGKENLLTRKAVSGVLPQTLGVPSSLVAVGDVSGDKIEDVVFVDRLGQLGMVSVDGLPGTISKSGEIAGK